MAEQNAHPEHAEKAYYVTTPIYYVNDAPHIGHAYTTVAGDVLTRWHRQRGEDVWYLTGTDEHGEKVLRTAEADGRRPRRSGPTDLVETELEAGARDDRRGQRRLHPDHRARATPSGSRSSGRRCTTRARSTRARYEGPYCVGCEEFKLARRAARRHRRPRGQQLCPIHGRPVEMLSEKNYFFRMSAYADRLLAFYEAHPEFVQPESARNEVLSFVRAGPAGPLDHAGRPSTGASRSRGTTRTSSTSGSTRCSTTRRRSGTATSRRPSGSRTPGRPTCTWSARTSCGSTP